MIEKFNNIFYLIVFFVHFAAYGVYAFKSVITTKSFIKQYGMDVTSAGIVRLFGGFFIGSILMALYILLVRDNGVQATWAFFNLVFVQNFVLFFIGYTTISSTNLVIQKKHQSNKFLHQGHSHY